MCIDKNSPELKSIKALYDKHTNSYYWPKRLYVDEISQYFPLYFMNYASNILLPEIIPNNLVRFKIKSLLATETLFKITQKTLNEYDNRCHVCGLKDKDNFCDEKWVYYHNGNNGTAFFAGLYPYCKDCFYVKDYNNYNLKFLKDYKSYKNITPEEQKQLSMLARVVVLNKDHINKALDKIIKYISRVEYYKTINWDINLMILRKKFNIDIDTSNLVVKAT